LLSGKTFNEKPIKREEDVGLGNPSSMLREMREGCWGGLASAQHSTDAKCNR
jgi:hypothetical protein